MPSQKTTKASMVSHSGSVRNVKRKRSQRGKNHLLVYFPDILTTCGDVILNGKRLENLLSLRVDIPAGKDLPFLKVTAEFMSSVRIESFLTTAKVHGRRIEFTRNVDGSQNRLPLGAGGHNVLASSK
jgi:hypothetical protein